MFTRQSYINSLKRSTLLLFAALFPIWVQTAPARAESGHLNDHAHAAVKAAEIRGEALLQQCVRVSLERVPEADQKVIREQWRRLGQVLGTKEFAGRARSSEALLVKLSPSGRDRAAFLIQWMRLQSQMREMFPDEQVMGSRQGGLNALAIRILLEQSLQYPRAIGQETNSLMNRIKSKNAGPEQSRALATLAIFEDSLVRESKRVSIQNENADQEFRAHSRPVMIAVGGAAAFVGALVYAGPILAGSVATAEAVGLPAGVGSVVGMSGVASLGATGIEIVNEIARPLWIKARRDAIERDIPLSCALEKEVEIGKVLEIEKLMESAAHGAMVGAAVGTLTVMTPAILNFLGGKLVYMGTQQVWVPMVSAGLWTMWSASLVDELALFAVTGLVATGATWEFYRGNLNMRATITFQDVIDKAQEQVKRARTAGKVQLAARLERVVRQVRSVQSNYGGDVIEQMVNFAVCGYLLMHMAHGEFAIALEGEIEEVVEVLATSSDDAPTGINAAMSAVKQLWATAQSAPISMKVYMLRAKMNLLQRAESVSPEKQRAIEQSIAGLDEYIEMSHVELMDKIKEAQTYLDKQKM